MKIFEMYFSITKTKLVLPVQQTTTQMFLESINIFHQAHVSSAAGKDPLFLISLDNEKLLTVDHHEAKLDTIRLKYGPGIVFDLRPSPQGISKIKLNNLPKGNLKVELLRQGKMYTQKFKL